MSNSISIFTDGACRGNPGPGGWGVLILLEGEEITLYGGENSTTNNQMEMMAAIKALEYFREKKSIELVTDSNYLKDGIEKWIHGWKKNGWKTSAKKPVKNQELWMKIDTLNHFHEVQWKWVKGHSGHRENEIADLLANKGIDEL
jgi:ribonuclease HI|tara:strand:+ start:299 stop:733 length:435 start_codon:yes stop_codon:yes gene_type:complete